MTGLAKTFGAHAFSTDFGPVTAKSVNTVAKQAMGQQLLIMLAQPNCDERDAIALVLHGACLQERDSTRNYADALMQAITFGHRKVALFLIRDMEKYNLLPGARDSFGATHLMYAAHAKDLVILTALLNKKSTSPEDTDRNCHSAWNYAARRLDNEDVRLALEVDAIVRRTRDIIRRGADAEPEAPDIKIVRERLGFDRTRR